MNINHAIQLQHRRLRERFRLETIERHADRLLRAIYRRVYRNRADEMIAVVDKLQREFDCGFPACPCKPGQMCNVVLGSTH